MDICDLNLASQDRQYLKSRCSQLEVGDYSTFFLCSPLSDEELQKVMIWMNNERSNMTNRGEIVLKSSGKLKLEFYFEIVVMEIPDTAESN